MNKKKQKKKPSIHPAKTHHKFGDKEKPRRLHCMILLGSANS